MAKGQPRRQIRVQGMSRVPLNFNQTVTHGRTGAVDAGKEVTRMLWYPVWFGPVVPFHLLLLTTPPA